MTGRGFYIIIGAIIAGVFFVSQLHAQSSASPNWQRINSAIVRHDRAIHDLRVLVVRTCAIHQFRDDWSAYWERDDDTRNFCAEFVAQIGK